MSVTVFSTSRCPWCVKAKEHLTEIGVDFRAVNIEEDKEGAREIVEKTRQMAVPVTKIGERYIVGYDPDTIDKVLREEGILK